MLFLSLLEVTSNMHVVIAVSVTGGALTSRSLATSYFCVCMCVFEIDKSGRDKVGQGNVNRMLIDGCCHPIPLALVLHTLAFANLISALIECNLLKTGALINISRIIFSH